MKEWFCDERQDRKKRVKKQINKLRWCKCKKGKCIGDKNEIIKRKNTKKWK